METSEIHALGMLLAFGKGKKNTRLQLVSFTLSEQWRTLGGGGGGGGGEGAIGKPNIGTKYQEQVEQGNTPASM